MINDFFWKRNLDKHYIVGLPNYVQESLYSSFLSLKENNQLEKNTFSKVIKTKNINLYETFHPLCYEILLSIQTNEEICNQLKINQKKLTLKNLYFLDYKKNQKDLWHTFNHLGDLVFFICLDNDSSNRFYKTKPHSDTEVVIGHQKNIMYVCDANSIFRSDPVKDHLTLAVGILKFTERDKSFSDKMYWLSHDLPLRIKILNKIKKIWN